MRYKTITLELLQHEYPAIRRHREGARSVHQALACLFTSRTGDDDRRHSLVVCARSVGKLQDHHATQAVTDRDYIALRVDDEIVVKRQGEEAKALCLVHIEGRLVIERDLAQLVLI